MVKYVCSSCDSEWGSLGDCILGSRKYSGTKNSITVETKECKYSEAVLLNNVC